MVSAQSQDLFPTKRIAKYFDSSFFCNSTISGRILPALMEKSNKKVPLIGIEPKTA